MLPAGSTAGGEALPARIPPPGAGLPAPDPEWRATGLEPAVFADPSGRRARTMSGVGLALVSVTLAALAIVVTGVVGFTRLPLPGLPAPPALAAAPAHHPGHAVLVAGVRPDLRHRGVLLRGGPAPRDVDHRERVRD